MSQIHQLALTLIPGVGPVIARKLTDHFGSAAAVFAAGRQELNQVEGIRAPAVTAILESDALEAAEKQLRAASDPGIRMLFYTDPDYPSRLKECHDAPVLLYYKGKASLNHPRVVSIVGTRRPTPYGLLMCRQLTESLQACGVMVVSGLAYGIDVEAHRQSLAQGLPTIGVLGHGLGMLYPAAHRQIAGEMLVNGGLLTEFPYTAVASPENFPKRNRIIAGIADATIVVEAALKGGALITAELADSYHKEVFALPGRITDSASAGCNFLIRNHKAAILYHPDDLAVQLGWTPVSPPPAARQQQAVAALPEGLERQVCTALLEGARSLDALCMELGCVQGMLSVTLLSLEISGIIRALPGSMYELV